MGSMPDQPVATADPALLALTDQCVMCGLCLPHCPTYRLDRHESESPRGRIAVARALARGDAVLTPVAVEHLDHCLACLACQKVCPSQVRYEDILNRTRAMLAPARPRRVWARLTPARLTLLARLATVLGAGHWLPKLAGLVPGKSLARRFAAEMPVAPPRLRRLPVGRTETTPRGRVTLFPGCVATVFDRDTLQAARILLEALGYQVDMPTQAVCCGALALHAGDSAMARDNATTTRAALEALPARTVLVSASGCLGSLRYPTLASSTLTVASVAQFLASDPAFAELRFKPLAARAALHVPCTEASVGDGGAATRRLLARIPQLERIDLPEQPRCCGAAGTHFIEHADRADRLRGEKLDQLSAVSPMLLLTGNVGCRIFLGNALRRQDAAIEVLHPLALLARQLETPDP